MIDVTSERGFQDVDRASDPAALVGYLDLASAQEKVRQYKRESFALLGARAGGRFLDVGCGTGEDALALAEIVGLGGWVVGVDRSETMIAEARRRAAGTALPLEYHVGDIYALAFPDGAFDGCRADRVFQHLAEPDRALAELVRVTRPGGRIVVFDPDWDTLIVDAPDRGLARRIRDFNCDRHADGWSARQMPRRLRGQGLTEIAIVPYPYVGTDRALAESLFSLPQAVAGAREAGVVSEDEAAAWSRQLEEADRTGTFFCALTGFTVAGTKR